MVSWKMQIDRVYTVRYDPTLYTHRRDEGMLSWWVSLSSCSSGSLATAIRRCVKSVDGRLQGILA